ncbi:MAG: VCBS repeat-containing protein [Gemmataceae bacterium]
MTSFLPHWARSRRSHRLSSRPMYWPRLETLEDRTLLTVHLFAASNTPVALAASSSAPLTFTSVRVPDSILIENLEVTLNIRGARTDGMTVSLWKDGLGTWLFHRLPGTGLTNTTFSDRADFSITQGLSPFTGRWRPYAGLGQYQDKDARGDWWLVVNNPVNGNAGTLEGWSLAIDDGAVPEREPNNTPATAMPLPSVQRGYSNPLRPLPVTGQMASGDTDTFSFNFGLGLVSARVKADGFVPRLTVIDSTGQVLSQSDAAGNLPPTATGVPGSTYYLQVESADGGTGTYSLLPAFQPPESNWPYMNPDGTALASYSLDSPGAEKLIPFTSSYSGFLTVTMDAAAWSGLDSRLTVRDVSLAVLAEDDNGGGGTNSRVTIPVVANQPIYLQTAGVSGTTGAFDLRLSLSQSEQEPNDTVETATERAALATPVTGSLTANDVDTFRFPVTTSGLGVFKLTTPSFTGRLSVLDPQGAVVAMVQTPVGGGEVEIAAPVEGAWWPPTAYYLRVDSPDGGTGDYALETAFRWAYPSGLQADPSTGRVVTTDYQFEPGGYGYYAVNVPSPSTVTVTLQAPNYSGRVPAFTVWSAWRELLAVSPGAVDGRAQVTVPVSAGTVIYVLTSGVGGTTGPAELEVTALQAELEPNDTPESAQPLTLQVASFAEGFPRSVWFPVAGSLRAGDTDTYSVWLDGSGIFRARLTAESAPVRVTIVDGSGQVLGQITTAPGESADWALALPATSLWFRVEALDGNTGDYRLETSLVKPAAINLSADGTGSLALGLSGPGDRRLVSVFSPAGELAVTLMGSDGLPVAGGLVFRDAAMQPLAAREVPGRGLVVTAPPGGVLVEVGGQEAGSYRLDATFTQQEQEDNDTPATANLILFTSGLQGEITRGDRDTFSLTTPGSLQRLTLTLETPGWNAVLRLLDSTGKVLAEVVGTDRQRVSLRDYVGSVGNVWVQVAGRDGATGTYRLLPAWESVSVGFLGQDPTATAIAVPGEDLFFEYYATTSGLLVVTAEATDGSGVRPDVSIVDAQLQQLGTGSGPGRRSEASAPVSAWYSTRIRVRGAGGSTGAFVLTTRVIPDYVGNTPDRADLLNPAYGILKTDGINYPGDVDVYAAETYWGGSPDRSVRFEFAPAPGSPLRARLELLDDAGNVLSTSPLATDSSRPVTLTLAQQQYRQYFVRVLADPAATDAARAGGYVLRMQAAVREVEPNDTPETASPPLQDWSATPNTLAGTLPAGDVDVIPLGVQWGRLEVVVTAQGPLRLSLLGADGRVLVETDGDPTGGAVRLAHYFTGSGPYGSGAMVRLESRGAGAGDYWLTWKVDTNSAWPGDAPNRVFGWTAQPSFLLVSDADRDGRADLVSGGGLGQGRGDGSFDFLGRQVTYPAPWWFSGPVITAGVVADFDGDGEPELAVGGSNSPTVGVGAAYAPAGAGYLAPPALQVTPAGPSSGVYALTAGDFTGDGKPDLLVGLGGTDGPVRLLVGRGDRSFADAITLPGDVVGTVTALVVGDFDGDGAIDVAAATGGTEPGYLWTWRGRGDGTFADPVRQARSAAGARLLALDADGDGRTDLAVTDPAAGTVTLWRGVAGGLTVGGTWNVGSQPGAIAAGDLDGDGRTDLVVLQVGAKQARVLRNGGGGTFILTPAFAAPQGHGELTLGDVNGDGYLDLVFGRVEADASSGYLFWQVTFGRGDGTFVATPTVPQVEGISRPVLADFNGDGLLDLVTLAADGRGNTLQLRSGLGDGTFLPGVQIEAGSAPTALATGDLTGDGQADLLVADAVGSLFVFPGQARGGFGPARRLDGLESPGTIAVGDFDRDGAADVALLVQSGRAVQVLQGVGDGSLTPGAIFLLAYPASNLLAADLNGDGTTDLVAGSTSPAGGLWATSLVSRGDGTFRAWIEGLNGPPGLNAAADFNGDGRADLVSEGGFLFLGRGDGSFTASRQVVAQQDFIPSFGTLKSVTAGDFNRDGLIDLVLAQGQSDQYKLWVVFGRGDGTFQKPYDALGGSGTNHPAMLAADLNRDGNLDLFVDPREPISAPVLLGGSNGFLQSDGRRTWFQVGGPSLTAEASGPMGLATADFDRDGRLDAATAEPASGTLTVSLGLGDGTFRDSTLSLTPGIQAVAAADLNGDGRADLAVANFLAGTVAVLYGVGDGTFRDPVWYNVGLGPVALAAADLDGDNRPDLVTVDVFGNTVSVLWNDVVGGFTPAALPVGQGPRGLAVGDFDGDGRIDLATADFRAGGVSVLYGAGGRRFEPARAVATRDRPVRLAAGDFDRDGRTDLVVAHLGTDSRLVSLVSGAGRTFASVPWWNTGPNADIVTADLDADGHLDLVAAGINYFSSYSGMIVLGLGLDEQGRPASLGTTGILNVQAAGFAVADFNGDGLPDFAALNAGRPGLTVLAGRGDRSFAPPDQRLTAPRNRPVAADLDGDGRTDVLVANAEGRVLFRRGRPGTVDLFDSPQPVSGEGMGAARDVTVVRTAAGLRVVTLQSGARRLDLYTQDAGGFLRTDELAISEPLPFRVVAGDLDGDRREDLVVLTAGRRLVPFFQTPDGTFTAGPASNTEFAPTDLVLADQDGDGRAEVLVLSEYAGTLGVYRLSPNRSLARDGLFAADPTPARTAGTYNGQSNTWEFSTAALGGPTALLVGPFTGPLGTDVLVAQGEMNQVTLLTANATGGFATPSPERSVRASSRPFALAAGYFDGDTTFDFAVLVRDSGEVWVYTGDGHGGFTLASRTPAGDRPTGLATADADGDGRLDLLVTNAYGDVLPLLSQGDGTFRTYVAGGREVALAVADLDGDGRDDVVLGQRDLNRVTVSYGATEAGPVATDLRQGLFAPGAVRLIDLTGDGRSDLVVANTGGNNVLVYPGLPGGGFGPAVGGSRGFAVGTSPVALAFNDLDGDSRIDLAVANRGSDDVTVLLSRGTGDTWTMVSGSRLQAGAMPTDVVVRDATGDGLADLVVSNGAAGTVTLLPGLGTGFFNDTAAGRMVIPAGVNPGSILVGNFDRRPGLDLIVLNGGAGTLTLLSNFALPNPLLFTYASGGLNPVAGVSGDFNSDGLQDLVVANGGGELGLFLGGDAGLSLVGSVAIPGLFPTDLALAGFGEGEVSGYVAGEGLAGALRWTLSWLAPEAIAEGAVEQGAQLVPLQADTSVLTLVAVLLTTAVIDVQAPASGGGDAPFEPVFATFVPPAVVPVPDPGADPGGDESTEEEPGNEVGENLPPVDPPAVTDQVLGTDEALRQAAEGLRSRWFPEPAADVALAVRLSNIVVSLGGPAEAALRACGAGLRAAAEVVWLLAGNRPQVSSADPAAGEEAGAAERNVAVAPTDSSTGQESSVEEEGNAAATASNDGSWPGHLVRWVALFLAAVGAGRLAYTAQRPPDRSRRKPRLRN